MTDALTQRYSFVLPAQVEALLASAARYLKEQGRTELVSVITNARFEVDESVDENSWGHQAGHRVRLHLPEALFHRVLEKRNDYGSDVLELLRQFATPVADEYFWQVALCLDHSTVPTNWREDTGTLLVPPTLSQAADSDVIRLWGDGAPRVFLSHRADFKRETKELKEELAKYGAASFVAHDDIEPTRDWQTEIERALASMDVLVAVISEGFAASHWTNQEVGVALGRGIPVFALRITEDPRGFISVSQAINGQGRSAADWARGLVAVFSIHDSLVRPLQAGLVREWERVANFSDAIRIMGLLDACKAMPADLLARIEAAFATNDQLHGSVGVNKKYPSFLDRMKALLRE